MDELREAIGKLEKARRDASRRIDNGTGRVTVLAGEVAAFDKSIGILNDLIAERKQGRLAA